MVNNDITVKLKDEFDKLKIINRKQFEQRFTTSKYEDKWQDDLFRDYQNCRIRIDLLLELLE